jgi:SAM-dependent methyltransferase
VRIALGSMIENDAIAGRRRHTLENRISKYYSEKLKSHGTTHLGADWNSVESQQLRFDQLLRLCLEGEQFSLNDLGCGYGALFDHMVAKGFQRFEYFGYDISADMIYAAQKLHGEKTNAHFICGGCPETADYTVASGIFNVKLDTPDHDWLDYVLETITTMGTSSRTGFAFNCLTKYSDPELRQDRLFYADPCFFFNWCKMNGSGNVALLHDYGLYEFTMIVRK